MSYWTHIMGVIKIDTIGTTQPEKRYILETVLAHLPIVTGSEDDMYTFIIQSEIMNSTSSRDEFFQSTNLAKDDYGNYDRNGWFRTTDYYYVGVYGNFRDRNFETTFKEFSKWLCRLAKREIVDDVCVHLTDEFRDYYFTNENDVYRNMFEWSKVHKGGKPAWTDYLRFERCESGLPRLLEYKYYNNPENDRKVQDWIRK